MAMGHCQSCDRYATVEPVTGHRGGKPILMCLDCHMRTLRLSAKLWWVDHRLEVAFYAIGGICALSLIASL